MAHSSNFDFPSLIDASRNALEGQRWSEAIALCRSALPSAAVHAKLLMNIGKAHSGLGEWAQAKAALETALQHDPGLLDARAHTITACLQLEDWSGVVEHSEALGKRVADLHAAFPNLGVCALKAYSEKAAARGERSLPLDRILLGTIVQAATEYYNSGKLIVAEAVCRFSIPKLQGHSSLILQVMSASINVMLGRTDNALERFQHLMRHPAASPDSVMSVIGHFCKDMDREAVLRLLRCFADAAKAAEDWRYMIAVSIGFTHNDSHSDGFELVSLAVSLAPEMAEPRFYLANMMSSAGDLDGAVDNYKDLISRHPSYWLGYFHLVRVLRILGRHEEADIYEHRQQAMPRSDGDDLSFLELGQSGLVDMSDVAKYKNHQSTVRPQWHRTDDIRFFPSSFSQGGISTLINQHFLEQGSAPPQPVFAKDASLVTLGSCFATYIRRYLAQRGKVSQVVQVAEEVNNSWALRNYVEWSLTGNEDAISYWYESGSERHVPPRPYEEYRDLFVKADGFVFTVGVGEIWRDRETGGVFWKGVPEQHFKEGRHELVLSSVDDNLENLRYISDLLRKHCGDKPIVFTLSPVPLKATFREIPCLVADCASKSVLRTAIELLMSDRRADVYYWPSYEIIRWMGAHLPRAMFGAGQLGANGTRHVEHDVIQSVVDSFVSSYFAK